MVKKTLDFNVAEVTFDPTVNKARGLFKHNEPDAGPPEYRQAPKAGDGNRLLQLLYFLFYTQQGRKVLDDNRLNKKNEAQIRVDLATSLQAQFAVKDPALTAIIEAHLAGDRYAMAFKEGDAAAAKAQGDLYSDRVFAVLAVLHDDAMGYEFSCAW